MSAVLSLSKGPSQGAALSPSKGAALSLSKGG